MPKTLVHIIDNLSRGGAETMLLTVLKNLPGYRNIIITLNEINEFGDDVECDELICLQMKSPYGIPAAAIKLNAIIKNYKVDLVHSHLFWSTVVARLGVPRHVPLFTTIHVFTVSLMQYEPWYMKMIERCTYRLRQSNIIAVAKGALDEYFSFVNVKRHHGNYLYTFVNPIFLNQAAAMAKKENQPFKIISVGNLKEQKNHRFLLEAFKDLKDQNITLDIYGKGVLQQDLQRTIDQHQLKVNLKGQAVNIHELLPQYDLFVMSSAYEGFSLSVLEAMATGLPMLLTDIPSFKEQCDATAVYYKLNDKVDFVSKLHSLKNDPNLLSQSASAARKRVEENYTLPKHLQGLQDIYRNALGTSQPAL